MDLSKAIRVALAQRAMNQSDLAVKMGTGVANISAIINRGSSTTETVKKLADVFGMKVSDLMKLGED